MGRGRSDQGVCPRSDPGRRPCYSQSASTTRRWADRAARTSTERHPGFRTRHSFQTAVPCHNSPGCSSFATGSRSQSADTHAFVQHLRAACQAGFLHPMSALCTLIYPGKRPRLSPARSPTSPGPRGVSVSWSEFKAVGGRAFTERLSKARHRVIGMAAGQSAADRPSSRGAADAVRLSAAYQFPPGERITQAAEQGWEYLRE